MRFAISIGAWGGRAFVAVSRRSRMPPWSFSRSMRVRMTSTRGSRRIRSEWILFFSFRDRNWVARLSLGSSGQSGPRTSPRRKLCQVVVVSVPLTIGTSLDDTALALSLRSLPLFHHLFIIHQWKRRSDRFFVSLVNAFRSKSLSLLNIWDVRYAWLTQKI